MASDTSTCNGFFNDNGNHAMHHGNHAMNYFTHVSNSSAVNGASSTNGNSNGSGASGTSDSSNNESPNSNGSNSVNSSNHRGNNNSNSVSNNQWNDLQSRQHQPISLHHSHHQQSHQSAGLTGTSGTHHNPHHSHISAINHSSSQNIPVASNTHSIFGTGNFHYKTNNSWNIPGLSCYPRIYSDPHYQRNFHSTDANTHSNPVATSASSNESLVSNQHQQSHHHSHHHHHHNHQGAGAEANSGSGGTNGTTVIKRFHHILPNTGKSGNNKEICGDDKFKEDGDPWNVEAQAAFLGPNLWDKTLPYDADLKVTQYADLDEFLSENNIPDGLPGTHLGHGTGLGHRSDSLSHSTGLSLGLGHITTKRERSPSPSDCISPDTLNPPSPAESTFSFASSGRDFDPRTRAFSDEELKPQPMIKKSRKQFVPDELKDDKYWARRRKNNIAAKRSRDARRQKENQIAMRARYLEKENANLHQEVEQLKQENMDLRARLSKFQEV